MLRSVHERFGLGQIIVERYQRQLNIIAEAVRAGLPIREVKPDKDKLSRALPLVARMEHGTVWFPKNALWMSDLERELLAFPGGRHDDFVDTLAYAAIDIASRSSGEGSGFMSL
jgi:predicted phage terminase large subunit-like protein